MIDYHRMLVSQWVVKLFTLCMFQNLEERLSEEKIINKCIPDRFHAENDTYATDGFD